MSSDRLRLGGASPPLGRRQLRFRAQAHCRQAARVRMHTSDRSPSIARASAARGDPAGPTSVFSHARPCWLGPARPGSFRRGRQPKGEVEEGNEGKASTVTIGALAMWRFWYQAHIRESVDGAGCAVCPSCGGAAAAHTHRPRCRHRAQASEGGGKSKAGCHRKPEHPQHLATQVAHNLRDFSFFGWLAVPRQAPKKHFLTALGPFMRPLPVGLPVYELNLCSMDMRKGLLARGVPQGGG